VEVIDTCSATQLKGAEGVSNLILKEMKKAIEDYCLIEENDKILIAVSGGKDSLTLLKFLTEIRSSSSTYFDILAAHIKTDFACSSCAHKDVLDKFFNEADVEYVYRDIKVLDHKRETNCFWCSWNRRKALFDIAKEFGCNKIALGHHKDDIVETVLLNMFFKGNISCMKPRQELFGGEMVLIRPLCYVEENAVREFARISNFPSKLCQCPFGRSSKRKKIKDYIREVQGSVPGADIKANIFNGMSGMSNRGNGVK
jgi:tRNA(Ile)-lysidine synthase TilS/MesJ